MEISANLPSDILIDIFTRLPVKSLAQYKTVSKFMHALLSSPKFVKQHLRKSTLKNPNLILKFGLKFFYVDDEEWSKVRKLQFPFASSLDNVELSGSCNGLLCLSDHQCNEDIFLYNPSIKIFKKLPVPNFDVPTIESKCFTTVGFGYHQEKDDYKVVRCVYLYDKPFIDIDSYQCEARVYSLKTNKWNKIGHIPFHLGYRATVWLGNEFLVWKASYGLGKRVTFHVVSFDMNKEEFNEIPQPIVNYDFKNTQMEVGVLGDQLSIFYLWRDIGVDIWSMKESSWTKMFMIPRPEVIDNYYMFLRPLAMLKNGEILIEAGERARVLYNPRTGRFNIVNIKGAPPRFLANTNVGSLVSPLSYNSEIA